MRTMFILWNNASNMQSIYSAEKTKSTDDLFFSKASQLCVPFEQDYEGWPWLVHKEMLDKQSSKTGIVLVSLPGVGDFVNDTTKSSIDPLNPSERKLHKTSVSAKSLDGTPSADEVSIETGSDERVSCTVNREGRRHPLIDWILCCFVWLIARWKSSSIRSFRRSEMIVLFWKWVSSINLICSIDPNSTR